MHLYKEVFKKQMLGFAVTGTLSTLLMLVIYVGLNKFMNYQYAYLIAYSISVMTLYLMNVLLVFKNRLLLKSFLKFLLIYVLQYLLGAIFLELIVRLGFSDMFAPVLVIMIILPLTFILNRMVLLKEQRAPIRAEHAQDLL